MRQIAPVSPVSAPLQPVRNASAAHGLHNAAPQANKSPAVNQPWFGRDECHCDDGPERMTQRAVRARW